MRGKPPGGRLAYTIRHAYTGEFWDFARGCWSPRPAEAKGHGPGPLAWRDAFDLFHSSGPAPFRGTYLVEITREFDGAEIREACAFWPFASAAAFVFPNQQQEGDQAGARERPRPAPRQDEPRPAGPGPRIRPAPAPAGRAAGAGGGKGPEPKRKDAAKARPKGIHRDDKGRGKSPARLR